MAQQQQQQQHGYATLVPSTSSSGVNGSALRGPRGSPSIYRSNNGMNDLHHLQMLHAQSTNPSLTTLLPLCPLGAASSQLSSSMHGGGGGGGGNSSLSHHHHHAAMALGMHSMGLLGAAAAAGAAAGLLGGSGGSGGPERIGAYTREERARRVARYKDKKQRRVWSKRVLYQVRKDFAVSRRRVGGRFIKKQNPGQFA